MEKSSYNSIDTLQQKLTTTGNMPSTPQKSTKFGSILNDLSSFLTTATNAAVTVDGIINDGKTSSGGGDLTPEQQIALLNARRSGFGGGTLPSILLWGGVAVVGSGIMYKLFKKKGN